MADSFKASYSYINCDTRKSPFIQRLSPKMAKHKRQLVRIIFVSTRVHFA